MARAKAQDSAGELCKARAKEDWGTHDSRGTPVLPPGMWRTATSVKPVRRWSRC